VIESQSGDICIKTCRLRQMIGKLCSKAHTDTYSYEKSCTWTRGCNLVSQKEVVTRLLSEHVSQFFRISQTNVLWHGFVCWKLHTDIGSPPGCRVIKEVFDNCVYGKLCTDLQAFCSWRKVAFWCCWRHGKVFAHCTHAETLQLVWPEREDEVRGSWYCRCSV